MFYEGRVNCTIQLEKDEILKVINETGEDLKAINKKHNRPERAGLYTNVIFIFDHEGKKFGFANDESNCEGITELAILDITNNTQIESLTIGWVKGDKLESILDCCNNPFSQSKTGITFDKDYNITSQPESGYTCGCCGSWFKSTWKIQNKFDQDSGYGICPSCEKGHY